MKDKIRAEIYELLKDGSAFDFIEISKKLNYSKELDEVVAETLTEMINNYDMLNCNFQEKQHHFYLNYCKFHKNLELDFFYLENKDPIFWLDLKS